MLDYFIKIIICILLLVLIIIKINKFENFDTTINSSFVNLYNKLINNTNISLNDINLDTIKFNNRVNLQTDKKLSNKSFLLLKKSKFIPPKTIISYYFENDENKSSDLWWLKPEINGWIICDGNSYQYTFNNDTLLYEIKKVTKTTQGENVIHTPDLNGKILYGSTDKNLKGDKTFMLKPEHIIQHTHTSPAYTISNIKFFNTEKTNISNKTGSGIISKHVHSNDNSARDSDALSHSYKNTNQQPIDLTIPFHTIIYLIKI